MFLSKSFGYALRGILYIALMQDEKRKVQIGEIADKLSVPKHFLGKIMQQMVKKGLLHSTKGPYGGFTVTETTLSQPIIKLVEITDGMDQFKVCLLRLKNCDGTSPCPLHNEMEEVKTRMLNLFENTTVGDLITDNKSSFIKSLSAT
jgi:Rrf2 family protein